MKSISSVGIVVISAGFLLICHVCAFVSCEEPCGEECDWNVEKGECICPGEEPENSFLIRNRRSKQFSKISLLQDRVCLHHNGTCISNGDPHITTFHRNLYHLYKPGVYTLVQLTTGNRLLWIQAKQVVWHADASRAVNCGVMAREGNSIIGIINCDETSPLIVKYQLNETAPSGSIRTISGGWKMTLVSGIEIEVIRWDSGKYMHVHVNGLESEFKQYRGLCSVTSTDVPYNSVCKDLDCDQYRVHDYDSFFSIPLGILPECGNNDILPQCVCKGIYPNCADPQDISISYTKKCIKHPNKRGNEYDQENDDFADKYHIPDDSINDPIESEVVNRGLNMGYRFFGRVRKLNPVSSVEDGRSRCNYALKLSPTYELCSSKVDSSTILESCALDENLMKEDGPAKSIATEFETVCLDNIRLSIESSTTAESLQELKDLLAKVEKLVCPSQCNQNGKCVDSKCQCNEGFMGTDCSLRIEQAPVVKKSLRPWPRRRPYFPHSTNCDDGFENCT